MFRETLQKVVEETEGAMAALLMGYDGITLDQYTRTEGPKDVETVGMELSVILKNIRATAELLASGSAEEVAIRMEQVTTVIRMLNDEYFIAVTVAPGGNSAKARYLLRTHAGQLQEALA